MSTQTTVPQTSLAPSDYASAQDVRWCPGCGDYAILAQMKKVLASLGIPARSWSSSPGSAAPAGFPYYMETYGIHSIHGRAPAVATGLKTVRPDLSVWVITGDGDGLSIGGNHLIHCLRRNLDVNIILFNNRIYGLTKGQYSPTSPLGQVTKSTPMGSIDNPLHILSVAIGCEATFVARTVDVHQQHLGMVLRRAAEHRGTSFVEVYQNCVVFNDGAFEYAADRQLRAEHTLELEHGKPLIFGKNRDKGIRLKGLEPEIVHSRQRDHREGPPGTRRTSRTTQSGLPPEPDALSRLPRADGRLPGRGPAEIRRAAQRPGRRGHPDAGAGRPGRTVPLRRHVGGPVRARITGPHAVLQKSVAS